jgi:FixJ family two-component response regulator
MSGLGLLEHLRGSDCDVPIILITGNPAGNSEAFYRERGATAFFRKPIDGDALVEVIRSVWSGPESKLG